MTTRQRTVGFLIAAVGTVVVAMAGVFGGVVAYDPLPEVVTAGPARFGADNWWPLVVYGPWMVASLSILRSALYRDPATHAWCVVLFFSALAVALCMAREPKTLHGICAVALPVVVALTVFQLLVRGIARQQGPC
jgi:hypothetical protein